MSSVENKITIIFFPPVDFEHLWFKKIIIPLSQNGLFKIYVIDRPADLIIDALKGYKRLRKKFANKQPKNGVVKQFTPLLFFNEVIQETLCSRGNMNMKILIWQVNNLIKKEKIESDKLILWSYSPFHWKVMKEIPASRRIYGVEDENCYDHKDKFLKNAYNAERKMVLFSDEIICASEKLKEKFQRIKSKEKRIHLISVPADDRSFKINKIKKFKTWDIIPGFKAVIFGQIRYQTNLVLVEKLALKFPDISIIFIGKNRHKNFKYLLKKHKGIYHLGYLSRDSIIYCLRDAAIGLYPARKCKFSVYANPIRIYEYAAAGIPVVASNVSSETDFPESVKIVENDDDFILAIRCILRNGISSNDKKELIRFAKKHSAGEIIKNYIKAFSKIDE